MLFVLCKSDSDWSDQVLTVYEHTCIVCGAMDNITPHHVFPRSIKSTRLILENGVALCKMCHSNVEGMSAESQKRVHIALISEEVYLKLEVLSKQLIRGGYKKI